MYERLLLLLFAGILADQLAAQFSPCGSRWSTTDDTGIVYDASMGDGTACSPQLPNTCQGGPNAACTFSFRSYSYICCHDVWLKTGGTEKLYTKSNTEPNAGYEKP
uniref:Uncharacterized protein n=1 Tax=Plectus sambesii TaxID=2011161 RepID=A0A914VAR2_9BILA